MAKRTALEMVNVLMHRIKQDEIGGLASPSGHSTPALNYLNDAIIEMTNSNNGRWYTLLTNRIYQTSQNVVVTVLDYTGLSGKIITVTLNASAVVLTEGVEWTAGTNNSTTAASIASAMTTGLSGVTGTSDVDVATAVLTTPLNFTGMSAVTTDGASTDITVELSPNGVYAVASDYHSSLIIKNMTQNRVIYPDWSKVLDFDDPDEDSSGTTLVYTIENRSYKFHPKPASVDKIKEKYWKMPPKLTADADEYALPDTCEVALLTLAESNLQYFLDKSAKGDRLRILYNKSLLPDAKDSNDAILDKILTLDSSDSNPLNPSGLPLAPPFLGSNYTRQY